MKKLEIIKKQIDFNNIIKNGIYFKNNLFVIYKLINNENTYPKFGLAIGKKVGNAVTRNKLKRRVKFILDNNKKLFPKNYDYIIMIRKGSGEVEFEELNKKLTSLIKEKVII